ncbi:MAG: winged helix-turn-helix domain-containing protein [Myxococcales bacterium]|nr:winged helix-turn-helix domain-containing protein [Myxococcales bacterium]
MRGDLGPPWTRRLRCPMLPGDGGWWGSAVSDGERMNFAGLQDRLVPLVAELFATLASQNPLRMYFADIASKTLLDIVQVLRDDGISQEAIAASLGLTLNGYRAKMKRLREAQGDEDGGEEPRSLMERVFDAVADEPEGTLTQAELSDRFRGIKPDSLNGVTHFLVRSGLLDVEGRGPHRRFSVVTRTRAQAANVFDLAVLLYREGPLTAAEAARRLGCAVDHVDTLLGEIDEAGDLAVEAGNPPRYRATSYHVPLDTEEGYEAAIFDHVAAMVRALTKKLRLGRHHASLGDQIGGATFTLQVPVDDPLYGEVSGFLRENRVRLEDWLQRARALNDTGLAGREVRRFTLYVGQSVDEEG